MAKKNVPGTIYLIHFDTPYKHAGHYLGWTSDLTQRLTEHEAGSGARLMAVIVSAGISWRLAATWDGTRADERRLKNCGSSRRHCPICKES